MRKSVVAKKGVRKILMGIKKKRYKRLLEQVKNNVTPNMTIS